jgi:hypothetical protein
MIDFGRRPGESAAEWYERLRAVDPSALLPGRLDDLTFRRIQAEQAARREGATVGAEGGRGPADSDALRRCIESARRLSPPDRRRLMGWLESGMTD